MKGRKDDHDQTVITPAKDSAARRLFQESQDRLREALKQDIAKIDAQEHPGETFFPETLRKIDEGFAKELAKVISIAEFIRIVFDDEVMTSDGLLAVVAELLQRIPRTPNINRALEYLEAEQLETTERAPAKPRPAVEASASEDARQETRTAEELFGVAASKASRRHHRSDGPEFSDEELLDPTLLYAADKAANDRVKREKQGEVLRPVEIEAALRGGRFAKQARKRQRELGLR